MPDTLSRIIRHNLLCGLLGALCALLIQSDLSAQTSDPIPVYKWTTLAGRASIGNEDGPAADARFNNPHGLAMDLSGNLYVADTGNHTIRKISPSGHVSTYAGSANQSGSADGKGAAARFNAPEGIAVDLNGIVYVSDTGNHTIRKIANDGTVTTLAGQAGKSGTADGAASVALFDSPRRLTVDTKGNIYLYNGGLRKITAGHVATVHIPTASATFGQTSYGGMTLPITIHDCPAVDANGTLYFWSFATGSDSSGYWGFIATMTSSGQLSAIGSISDITVGTGQHAIFNDPAGNIYTTFDYLRGASGSYHFSGYPVRSQISAGSIRFGTSNGDPVSPSGFTVDQSGHWYYTRSSDNAIIRDNSTYAGRSAGIRNGTGEHANFDRIEYMDIDPSGNIWVAENISRFAPNLSSPSHYYNAIARKITPSGIVTTEFSTPTSRYSTYVNGITVDGSGTAYLANRSYTPVRIYRHLPSGTTDVLPDSPGYSVDELTSDLAGNLWAYSTYTHEILRKLINENWTAIAGANNEPSEIKDGIGSMARINNAKSLKADSSGDCYFLDYLTDSENSKDPTLTAYIRKVSPDGTVVTLSKNLGTKVTENEVTYNRYPTSLALSDDGVFFITDLSSIKQIDQEGNEIILGGSNVSTGHKDGIGDQSRFSAPDNIVVDSARNLYVTQNFGTIVRKGEFLGYAPGIITQPQSLTVNTGNNVQFSVSVTATTPAPTYQWYLNGQPFTGATSSTLSFTNARTSDAGDYTVVVTNELGSVTSNVAKLTVTAASAPSIPSGSSSGGGGGGGAPSIWFLGALTMFAFVRWLVRHRAYCI